MGLSLLLFLITPPSVFCFSLSFSPHRPNMMHGQVHRTGDPPLAISDHTFCCFLLFFLVRPEFGCLLVRAFFSVASNTSFFCTSKPPLLGRCLRFSLCYIVALAAGIFFLISRALFFRILCDFLPFRCRFCVGPRWPPSSLDAHVLIFCRTTTWIQHLFHPWGKGSPPRAPRRSCCVLGRYPLGLSAIFLTRAPSLPPSKALPGSLFPPIPFFQVQKRRPPSLEVLKVFF